MSNQTEVTSSEAAEFRRVMAMSEAEVDAELRAMCVDPDAAAAKVADRLSAVIRGGSFACPLCGKDAPHQHTPEEIVIFRNGAKSAAPGLLAALRRAVLALAHVSQRNRMYHDDYVAVNAALWKATGES